MSDPESHLLVGRGVREEERLKVGQEVRAQGGGGRCYVDKKGLEVPDQIIRHGEPCGTSSAH